MNHVCRGRAVLRATGEDAVVVVHCGSVCIRLAAVGCFGACWMCSSDSLLPQAATHTCCGRASKAVCDVSSQGPWSSSSRRMATSDCVALWCWLCLVWGNVCSKARPVVVGTPHATGLHSAHYWAPVHFQVLQSKAWFTGFGRCCLIGCCCCPRQWLLSHHGLTDSRCLATTVNLTWHWHSGSRRNNCRLISTGGQQ